MRVKYVKQTRKGFKDARFKAHRDAKKEVWYKDSPLISCKDGTLLHYFVNREYTLAGMRAPNNIE